MRKLSLLAILLLTLTTSQGVADTGSFVGGNDLYEACRSDYSGDFGKCIGYVQGIADAAATLANSGDAKCLFAIPRGVTAGQIRDVVVKWLTDHPQDRHYTASSLAISAFIDAFPNCGK
jgi:hypothetical protein